MSPYIFLYFSLKDLQYLNLAVNNICTIEGLSKCESLRRLDLTLNFIPPTALPSVASLAPCYDLRELHLLGNPCTQWTGYRAFIIAQLPQLRSLVRAVCCLLAYCLQKERHFDKAMAAHLTLILILLFCNAGWRRDNH